MAIIGKDLPPDIGKATQFQPGVSGNPAGKPPGTRSLSATIQEIMEDDDFEVELKGGAKLKGRPSKKITEVMYKLALSGNTKAADWIAKYGYGTKLDLTSGGDRITQPIAPSPELAADFAKYLEEKTKG